MMLEINLNETNLERLQHAHFATRSRHVWPVMHLPRLIHEVAQSRRSRGCHGAESNARMRTFELRLREGREHACRVIVLRWNRRDLRQQNAMKTQFSVRILTSSRRGGISCALAIAAT